ncbi:MAG: hypothetical protein A2600_09510 [Candidatus Lambdaproteobacteria bacterium RIFOXYD1_FULL_56_27]|uniref:DNA-binding response regulator n=1 Tax=Candidatus Lambdaproteobacteria bacterium RIFOXYD2_FULL_56_26 TaxID=1817773 RepID=A0A1F6GUS2_9PROT|nr:MAG: hypothetical protein A2557_04780 [Candidatus Lambdaproteobacteria bacterium RIFOXYD2_FULL_56_26]OGH02285.1 MAG: hypothetical protein A2426_03260 [Candidatus Lambdaproteobacteria bacterium RIFOXYC1_FULL_56_13]OGH10055.1 MAG: hypothetical protein A2600_09510 [Candidatus Lambdaproteobacteria bacterium RIFOXYD1_FULL_56_27]
MEKKDFKILVVDDHALFRHGIKKLLGDAFGPDQVFTAQDGQQAIEMIGGLLPDLVLTDIDMPRVDGFELVRWLKKEHPSIKVIALSMYQGELYQKNMFKEDADGYLIKDTAVEELLVAIDQVMSGKKYVAFKLSQKLTRPSLEPQPLSDREKEVLQLIAQGKTSKEIATELNLSHRTVESHRAKIMLKLNIDNLAGLIRYALDRGMA